MRTIAIVNQKGGSGKTTTAVNLAAVFARRGQRTLLIDIDPQGHCAVGLGVPDARIERTITDGLRGADDETFEVTDLLWEVSRNLHLIPATMRLAMLEAPGGGLHELTDKDRRLEKLIGRFKDRFDVCLIDCPPTIGLLTFNALRACREALIPVETGFFAFRGSKKQWDTITRLIAHINRPIACHILPTLHDPTSQLAGDILAALRREFAGQIVPVVIEEAEELREAVSFGRPIIEHAPKSQARRQYEALAAWLEDHAMRPVVPADAPETTSESSRGGRAAELAQRMGTPVPTPDRSEVTVSTAPTPNIAPPPAVSTPRSRALVHIAPPCPVAIELEAKPIRSRRPVATTTPSTTPASVPTRRRAQAHLYGVRQISRGALFIQPLTVGSRVCIAGDFNGWSATATPMQRNDDAQVYQAIVTLPPGRYVYRLVIDGVWQADPHHAMTQLNPHGEVNSVFLIKPRPATTERPQGPITTPTARPLPPVEIEVTPARPAPKPTIEQPASSVPEWSS